MAASFATIEGGDTPKPRQAALAFAPKIHNDDLIIWIYTSPDLGCWLMAKGLGWDTFFFVLVVAITGGRKTQAIILKSQKSKSTYPSKQHMIRSSKKGLKWGQKWFDFFADLSKGVMRSLLWHGRHSWTSSTKWTLGQQKTGYSLWPRVVVMTHNDKQ